MRHPLFPRLATAAALCLPLAALLPPPAPTTADPLSLEELLQIEAEIEQVAEHCIQTTVGLIYPNGSGAGGGSGVIISADGWILTAAHCIPKANQSLRVLLADGRRLEAITHGKESGRDFGLIQITEEGEWPYAEMGDSDSLVQDQLLLGVGHADGIKEGRPPVLRLGTYDGTQRGFLRSTCIIEPGDSGGPVFDQNGHVVGINSQIEVSLAQNLHVPVNRYQQNWDRLIASEVWSERGLRNRAGPPRRPKVSLGIRARGNGEAVEVTGVTPDSPAALAGLKMGDLITGVDGVRIRRKGDLATHMLDLESGDQIVLDLRRAEERFSLTVEVMARDDS